MPYRRYDLKSIVLRCMTPEELLESPNCFIPLFHGTDRCVLDLPKGKRQKLRAACMTFIDYAHPILEAQGISKMRMNDKTGLFGENQRRVIDAFIGASGMKGGNKWFEYDACYLTANPGKAMNYARRGYLYGELGYFADSFRIALDTIGWSYANMTLEQSEAYRLIKTASEKSVPDPVVLAYLGIPKKQITRENGCEVDWKSRIEFLLMDYNDGSFRVTEPFDILSGTIINVDDLPLVRE